MAVTLAAGTDHPSRERAELILSRLDQFPELPGRFERLLAANGGDDVLRELIVLVVDTVTRRPGRGGRDPFTIELWKHSFAVAGVCQMLIERRDGGSLGCEPFACGLLHDIGKLALSTCLPKGYARVVDFVERRRACICDAERELFGFDHTLAGKRLLERWRLPPAIVDSAWLHHQPPDALPRALSVSELVRIVHLSDGLVRRARIGFSGYGHADDVEESAKGLSLDQHVLDEVVADLPGCMEPWLDFLLSQTSDRGLQSSTGLHDAGCERGRNGEERFGANRQVVPHGACLDMLTRFARASAECRRVEDVCAAAADGLRTLLEVPCILAWAYGPSPRYIHLGVSDVSGSDRMASVVELDDPTASTVDEVPNGSGRSVIAPATKPHEALFRRHARVAPGGRLWTLPFVAGGRSAGAAIFAANDEFIAPWRSPSSACEALTASLGLAIASARFRADAERATDELLDLSRRGRVAEGERLRARTLSMMAEFSAGAAHELNNPLAVISGRAQMQLADCDDPERVRAFQIIVEQAHRASGIVADLMEFAKPPVPEPVSQPLGEVVESLLQHWYERSSLQEDQLVVRLVDDKVAVYADASQLWDILDSVIANAVEATVLETARLQINSPSHVSDETVRIVISDNGIGMTQDVLEHAAEPFYSERRAGRGRGLGLSRAHRFTEINGGKLWLESTPNLGTAVTIELPARAPLDARPTRAHARPLS